MTASTLPADQFHAADAARLLSLLAHDGALFGVRALFPAQETHFTADHQADALRLLERLDGKRPLYAVLNPIEAAVTRKTVKDRDIHCLRWFPLDADPERPADTASTDDEKAAAFAVMDAVHAFLLATLPTVSPSLLRGDSGNGAHLLIRLPDYPPHHLDEDGLPVVSGQDKDGDDTFERSGEWKRLKLIGNALCRRFSTPVVKMDRTVFNPSRLWRMYGTMNLKGENTPERPHRRAAILPNQADPVPFDLLAHFDTLAAALDITENKAAPKAEREAGSGEIPTIEIPTMTDTTPALPPWWNETVKPGERNSTAYQRARWLLNAHEGNRDEKQAWRELAAWNTTCCRPPLDRDELRRCFDSAANAGDNPDFARPAPPVLPVAAPWPASPNEAFYGLAGDIVRAIEPHTEADPVALLIQFLACFGNAIGRGPHFTAEADKHGGNLFAVLVGVSSKGRKGSSLGHVRRLFQQADPQWETSRVLSGLSSGEGLIYHVRDPLEKEETDKQTGARHTVMVDAGVTDKRLLVIESEFASVLRQTQRDGNTLSATLRNAWDSGRLQSLTKNNPTQATGAHVSIIGHITAGELRKDLAETETANGFGNRFLWVCVKRSKELPDGGQIDTVNFAPLLCRLKDALTHSRMTTRLARETTAREIWHAVYHDLSTGKPGLLGAMTGRAEAQVMRLALLFALLDCEAAIRAAHLTAALALWEYCEASARYIFGGSLGDRVADDILHVLRTNPAGLSRSDLSAHFGRNQSSGRIGQALAVLQEHGLAKTEQRETGGRAAEVWRAA